jgi:hypothetical protein
VVAARLAEFGRERKLSQPGADHDRVFFWFQILTCATNIWYKEMRTGQVCHHLPGPNANHGEIMASAEREAIRTRARMESENLCDQHLAAGDHTLSPAIWRLRRARIAQGPGDWLAGLRAGLRGDAYIYPAGVQNRLTWSAGFIEGPAQRVQRQVRIRVTPWFALLLWWLP